MIVARFAAGHLRRDQIQCVLLAFRDTLDVARLCDCDVGVSQDCLYPSVGSSELVQRRGQPAGRQADADHITADKLLRAAKTKTGFDSAKLRAFRSQSANLSQ
jgi:23S rRNA A1618 N6-methylase RlmF